CYLVRTGQKTVYFQIDALTFPIIQAPQNVLDGVGAPAEIRRIPSEEVFSPIGEQFRIVGRAPTTRDGIALEVDIDAAFLSFFKQLGVSSHRILVRTGYRLVGRCLRVTYQRQKYEAETVMSYEF